MSIKDQNGKQMTGSLRSTQAVTIANGNTRLKLRISPKKRIELRDQKGHNPGFDSFGVGKLTSKKQA
jgi:hypothetical protein